MNNYKFAIGMMSGTSLDGIDVVLLKIKGNYKDTSYEVIDFQIYSYEENMKEEIRNSFNNKTSSSELICSLNFKLGYLYADCVKKICKKNNINTSDLEYIANHGQTIYHIDKPYDKYIKSSLQIGDASVIANTCNTKVVSNFRCADIAAGGNGAPLVPYVDYILYSDKNLNRSIHNLGGISNLTYLKKDGLEEDIIAFDTGPANMMINRAMKILYNKEYDNNGEIASSGNIIDELLKELLSNKYFNMNIPKSTGRETFGDDITDLYLNKYKTFKKEDLIRTFTELTIISIKNSYKNYILKDNNLDEIIFMGGGALNKFLIKRIKEELKDIKIKTLEEIGGNSEAKEAIAFAILGNETLNNVKSNVLTATGAKRKVLLGQINFV